MENEVPTGLLEMLLPLVLPIGINAIMKLIMRSRKHKPHFILRTNAYAGALYALLIYVGLSISDPEIAETYFTPATFPLACIALAAFTMIPSLLLDFILKGLGKILRGLKKKETPSQESV
ncbi:MAG: hypothetical protein JKY34_09285 [Kordiimonadaceae bacterium]|nr:hypothetical protein [Kordiimonadaceae bacterium]